MARYPRRPRVPYAEMSAWDYLWWAFLIIFRLWLACQLVTGFFAAVYWLLPPDWREFMFAEYIALWDRYYAQLVPEELDWMPMWYEREAWPVIGLLLALRLVEMLRGRKWVRRLFPWAFGALTRKPEQRTPKRPRSRQRAKSDDGFEYDPARFTGQEGESQDQGGEPLQIEDQRGSGPTHHH